MKQSVEKNNKDQVFIRADLLKTSTGSTAYYRLDNHFRDFLNKCLEQHGEIEAVILTKENGKYHFNIGFVIPDEKDEGKLKT